MPLEIQRESELITVGAQRLLFALPGLLLLDLAWVWTYLWRNKRLNSLHQGVLCSFINKFPMLPMPEMRYYQ